MTEIIITPQQLVHLLTKGLQQTAASTAVLQRISQFQEENTAGDERMHLYFSDGNYECFDGAAQVPKITVLDFTTFLFKSGEQDGRS